MVMLYFPKNLNLSQSVKVFVWEVSYSSKASLPLRLRSPIHTDSKYDSLTFKYIQPGPGSTITKPVSGELLNLSVPHFPQLSTEDNSNTYPTGFSQRRRKATWIAGGTSHILESVSCFWRYFHLSQGGGDPRSAGQSVQVAWMSISRERHSQWLRFSFLQTCRWPQNLPQHRSLSGTELSLQFTCWSFNALYEGIWRWGL